jgi:hypothetical protein
LVVHPVAITRPFLATARIEVGEIRVGLLVGSELFLPPDDLILDIDVPGAALIAAVDAMGTFDHSIPGPLLAVDIAKTAVADLAGSVEWRRFI